MKSGGLLATDDWRSNRCAAVYHVERPSPDRSRIPTDRCDSRRQLHRPLLDTGPDPWVVWWKGFYYYSNSSGTNLTLRKTADITDLRHAQKKAVGFLNRGTPGRRNYGRQSSIVGATSGISTSLPMPATMPRIAFTSSRTTTMTLSREKVRSAIRATNGQLTQALLSFAVSLSKPTYHGKSTVICPADTSA